MSLSISYEIYSYRNGDWMLDSVHEDKQLSIHQANLLFDSLQHTHIKVIEERYDEATDDATSKEVFIKKPKPPKPDEETMKVKPVTKKKKAARSLDSMIAKVILGVVGGALGLIFLMAFLIITYE